MPTISGHVIDDKERPIENAEIEFFRLGRRAGVAYSNHDGNYELQPDEDPAAEDDRATDGPNTLRCKAFGVQIEQPASERDFRLILGLSLLYSGVSEVVEQIPIVLVGTTLYVRVHSSKEIPPRVEVEEWKVPENATASRRDREEIDVTFHRAASPRPLVAFVRDTEQNSQGNHARLVVSQMIGSKEPNVQKIGGEVGVQGDVGVRGRVGVTLQRTAALATLDQALWVAIHQRTHAMSFNRYREFMHRVLRGGEPLPENRANELQTSRGVDAYRALKYATEAFLLHQCGVFVSGERHSDVFDPEDEALRLGERYSPERMEERLREYLGEPPRLPYIRRIVEDAFPWLEREGQVHDPVLLERIDKPLLIELVHTYWMEEGMLMQTINALSQRFQNIRSTPGRDPLANLELDPLRRLNNWLWGFIQDEVNRLTVRRRAFEYLHHYGLPLYGKAVTELQPADNRSKFLEAFHNLLHKCALFFKEDFQTTIIADGYPLLNSLKEVHLILAQGAHNQFGDLTWTARVETLLIQFILSQPSIRDFLQSRAMVPYKESWMPQVDAMKSLQGWSDVSVTQFRDLAVYGEQILLAIRYGDWINVDNEDSAKNFARYFRSDLYAYMNAYRAVTGVDLTSSDQIDTMIPALHLRERLAAQQRAR
ncbi:MAG: hypothetical protein WBQ86_21540 [Candidatus Binatus sp.]